MLKQTGMKFVSFLISCFYIYIDSGRKLSEKLHFNSRIYLFQNIIYFLLFLREKKRRMFHKLIPLQILLLLLFNQSTEQSLSNLSLCTIGRHQLKCPSSHQITCRTTTDENEMLCATDKSMCDQFKHFLVQFRYSNGLKRFESYLAKYEKFIRSIKECPSEWKHNQVCLNRATCSLLEFNRMTSKFERKSEKCKCPIEFVSSCSNSKVCAVSDAACMAFANEAKQNKKLLENTEFCKNGNSAYLAFELIFFKFKFQKFKFNESSIVTSSRKVNRSQK